MGLGRSTDMVKLNATVVFPVVTNHSPPHFTMEQLCHGHRGPIMDGGFTKRQAHMTILNLLHGSKKFTIFFINQLWKQFFYPKLREKKKSIVVNVVKKVVTSESIACWITFR